MREALLCAFLLTACGAGLAAQAPASTEPSSPASPPANPPSSPPSSPSGGPSAGSSIDALQQVGIDYQLPPDWTVVETKTQPDSTAPPARAPAVVEPKRGTACIQVALTAQHGSPSSVAVVVTLPFDCFGEAMTEQDLAGFGSGAADGLKQAFDILTPVFGMYSLGSHRFWIERAKGNLNGHAAMPYTLEIACSLLKKGAACWMIMTADEADLRAFERAPVSLDGDAATPLVPPSAFDKRPS